MLNFMKKYKMELLSFFIPLLFFIVTLISLEMLIVVKKTFMISDLLAQYQSLFGYLKDVMSGKNNISYSFNYSIGGTMIGNFCYYLISPFNLILLFFAKEKIYMATLIIILLKISTSGFTMYKYFDYKFNEKNKWIYLMFSTAYALSGYVIGYYFHVMWLDGIYMLPLVFIGIEKILKNNNPLYYAIALFYTVITNFYIGFMICIGSVIYFMYELIINKDYHKDKKNVLKSIITFSLTSLFSGLATFFIVYPAFVSIMSSSKGGVNIFKINPRFSWNLLIIISRMTIGYQNVNGILNHHHPLIYCGVVMIPLLILYFINNKIEIKEKIASLLVILIFIISFRFNILNYIWHGFNVPLCYNQRYSFILIFFILIWSYKSLKNINSINNKVFKYLALVLPILSILIFFFEKTNLKIIYLIVSNVIYLIYILILYILNNKEYKVYFNKVLFSLFILTILELFLNISLSLRENSWMLAKQDTDFKNIVVKRIDKYKRTGNDFYRIEKDLAYTSNDNLLYNYNGVSTFLSGTSVHTLSFFKNIGQTAITNNISYAPTLTPYIDSILGIKYVLLRNGSFDLYKKIDEFDYSSFDNYLYGYGTKKVKVYENPYSLNLGYMVSDKVNNYLQMIIDGKRFNSFILQNIMLKSMNNSNQNLYINHKVKHKNKIGFVKKNGDTNIYEYEFINNQKEDYYIRFYVEPLNQDEADAKVQVFANGKVVSSGDVIHSSAIYLKNDFKQGETIKIRVLIDKVKLKTIAFVYHLNKDVLKKNIDELKNNQLELTKFSNTNIKGTVTATKDKNMLFLSIPYEKGWDVKVDGKKVKTYPLYGTFIGVKLKPGKHTIECTYHLSGIKIGIIVSIISLILGIIYICKIEKINNYLVNIYLKYEEIIMYLIFGVLTTLVSIITYWLFAKQFHISYLISTSLSWIISVLFAFVTNKLLVFKSKRNNHILSEIYSFYKYRVITLIIELSFMYYLVSIIKFNDMFAKVVVQIIVIILNYVFSKLFVFNHKKSSKN